MNVDKLARLFAAQGGSLRSLSGVNSEGVVGEQKAAAQSAVKVASDFGTATSEADLSARRSRVEELKKEVASGSYKPNSEEVAKAVYRELFL
jgi:anti-sigma28 factor (negative regulator of flagellin synthesis)